MSKFQKLTAGRPVGTSVQGTDIASGSATATQFLAADGSGNSAYRSIASGDLPSLSGIYLALSNYRAGKLALSASTTSVAVTFSTALPSTAYAMVANMINVTDTNPQFQPIVITALSTTGFTAKWNANLDTANYILTWHAIASN